MLSHFSHVCLFATLWTIAHKAPLSVGFSRQEYWSGLPCLLPGDLPDPGDQTCSSCISRWVPYHQCHLPPLRGVQSSRNLSILSLYIGHIPTFKSPDKWSEEKTKLAWTNHGSSFENGRGAHLSWTHQEGKAELEVRPLNRQSAASAINDDSSWVLTRQKYAFAFVFV